MASFLSLMAIFIFSFILVVHFWTATLPLSLRYEQPMLFLKQITFEATNQPLFFSTHTRLHAPTMTNNPW